MKTCRDIERLARARYLAAWDVGVTIREMAEHSGVSQATISRWLGEGGVVNGVETVDRLARAAP